MRRKSSAGRSALGRYPLHLVFGLAAAAAFLSSLAVSSVKIGPGRNFPRSNVCVSFGCPGKSAGELQQNSPKNVSAMVFNHVSIANMT